MALNLEELKFTVDTTELDAATKKISALGDALSKVNKPTKQAAIDAEKLALAQAKTALTAAKTEEANAKAALAAERLAKSQDSATGSSKNQVSVLEKQIMVLEYMAQGHSRGQASMMATAKVAGAVSSEIDELSKTLRTQRTLMGTDPFDKSIGALESWTNKLKVAEEVEQLYNKSLGLTKTQMQELAIEKQRLIALSVMEGKSTQQVEAEYQKIIGIAGALAQKQNVITGTIKQQEKDASNAAKATAYLADADARLAAALDVSNAKLDKAGSDALVKYEKALRQTGMSSDEAAVKLAKAKTQFDAIADKKQADKLQYLARAISVQMGDVGISLASGMNPLLVMIQQGDQIRGAIQQAGASGKQLEQAMAGAATQIATSFLQTGQAIGGFFVNAIKASGKAVTDFAMQITGTEQVLERLRYSIALSAGSDSKLMSLFKGAAAGLQILTGVLLVSAIAGFIALAKGLYDVVKEQDAMTVQLVKTGASLGINTTGAVAYAEALNSVGVNSGTALKVMQEMAKEGGFLAGEINMVVTSANNLKFAGVAIEDTVKQFAKLKEKPVEALNEIAKATGLVAPEVLKVVLELSKQGKESEAAAVAMKAYADVTIQQKDRLKTELSDFAIFMKSLSSNVGDFFDEVFRALWRKASPTENLKRQIKEVEETIRLGTQASPATKANNEATLAALKEQLKYSQQASDNDQTRISDQARLSKVFGEYAKDVSQFSSNKDKREKEIAEAQSKYQGLVKAGLITQVEYEKLLQNIRDKYKDEKGPAVTVSASKDLSIIQKDYNEQLRLAEGFAKDERSILKARFDAGLIERADFIAQDTDLLSRSEQKQLEVINSFSAKYKTAYEAQATLLAQAFGKAKDPENKKQLQEQLVNLTKDFEEFNATVEDTKSKIDSAFSAREQVALLEFEKAAFASTKTFKEYAKAQEDIAENKRIDLELQDRLTNAYGAEAASIKAVADETKRQTAEVSKFTKAQEEAYKQYLIVLNNPNASGTERGAAYSAYITAMTNANKAIDIARTSIVQAGIDAEILYYKQEYNRVNEEITKALVDNLGKGWKNTGKALRSVLEAELRKEITVNIRAVVDIVSSGLNSLLGGAKGSTLSSTIGSQISGIAIGGTTLGAAASAFGQGVVSGFSMGAPVSSIGSATSGAFNAGAAAAPTAGAVAGVAANRVISQDYEISKTMTKLQDVATVAAAFIPGLGPLVALGVGAVSGVANRAFGMKAKEITGEGIVGTLTTQGADVKAFEDWFQKGGWFRSNKSGRNFSKVSDTLQEYLDISLVGLDVTTKKYADALGLDASGLKDVTKSIELNLKGLSGEERQKKIDEYLSGFGDDLAKKLGLESYDALEKLGEQVLQQRYDLETQLLTLQGDTVTLRARERDKIYETNQALFDQVKALEDSKAAAEAAAKVTDEKTKLEQQLAILQGKTTQAAVDRAALLSDENRGIYDQIQALQDKTKAEEAYKAALESATKSVVDEIARLRGVDTNQAGLEAQFAILTAQARAGDTTALGKLPEVTKGLEQIAGATAVNATDIVMARARLAQSLQDTLGYTGANGFLSASPTATSISAISASGTGATATVSATSSNQELLSALVTEVQGLRAEVRADVSHNAKTAKILERANQDGETLSVSATIDGGVV
jgi:hypothetical protein